MAGCALGCIHDLGGVIALLVETGRQVQDSPGAVCDAETATLAPVNDYDDLAAALPGSRLI
jgi:hypothetical protein